MREAEDGVSMHFKMWESVILIMCACGYLVPKSNIMMDAGTEFMKISNKSTIVSEGNPFTATGRQDH